VKIEKLGTKIELLKTYKKGMMQKIFSQELRFKQDDGTEYPDWEEKKLGDILDYLQPSKYIVQNTTYDDCFPTPVLTAGKSFILGFSNETNNLFTETPIILFDDFTTDSRYIDFPFKVKSSAIKILKLKDSSANLKFVFEIMKIIQTPKDDHKRYWISEYQQIFIPFPTLEEQEKIANLLSNLDNLIHKTEDKLDTHKKLKKSLMQQLFS
jgi:type I restriction enzyme S subunit